MPISDSARSKTGRSRREANADTRPGWGRGLGLLGLVLAAALTLAGCGSAIDTTPVGAPISPVTASSDDGSFTSPSPIDIVPVTPSDSPSLSPSLSPSPSPSKAAVKAPVKAPKVTVPTTHRATHRPSPTPVAQSLCGAPKNPFGYNFCGRGGVIKHPASAVCDYFDCIESFWKGNGQMVERKDYTYSMSGGITGACSHHKGVLRTVYSG